MTASMARRVRLGHSPDPDDAFMFYGLAAGRVNGEGFEFEHVLEDIETLNRRALAAELEISAVSVHAFAHLADRYALMSCGASMGDGYGPIVVAREPLAPGDLAGKKIAVPGRLTSAYLALRLWAGRDLDVEVMPFDRIPEHVAEGRAAAGLLIHEGQLTFGRLGLLKVADLGMWWAGTHEGLPLPLGANAVRRDLGAKTMERLTRLVRRSIAYGLDHREEALEHALRFGRGLDRELADRFVGMYVNEWTLDLGDRGRLAVRTFLEEGARAGLVPPVARLDFVTG